jgi:uncharacterized membrane protein YoaK (UPF0700 family)
MSQFVSELRQTIVPGRNTRHGPLPPVLVAMTLVTGIVVLLGFALVGAPGFSIAASIAAIAAFGVGALVGGKIGSRFAPNRGALFSIAASTQAVFLVCGLILAGLSGTPLTNGSRYSVIVVLAIAMGIQNAAARTLAVPDLTTNVLTMTITGVAADSHVAGGEGAKAGRRLVAIAAMLVGAVVGATLVLHASIVYPLVIAVVVTAIAAGTSGVLARSNADWIQAQG